MSLVLRDSLRVLRGFVVNLSRCAAPNRRNMLWRASENRGQAYRDKGWSAALEAVNFLVWGSFAAVSQW